ncbi:MAG: universal stress protein [Vicinamibacterales bacterium]
MAPTAPVSLGRVLCPTDFSTFAAAALDVAAALAASYGSQVRVLHVVTPFPITAPFLDVPGNARLYESAAEQARRALAAEAARVESPGFTIDTELREGPAVQEILTAAEDWKADLIVLGSHGRGGFERLVLGSITEKVLRKASTAVLVVPGAAPGDGARSAMRFTHVLCAHDGSAASAAGVAYAVSLAERTGARLTLVSVAEAMPFGDSGGPAADAFRAAREQHAREALDAAVPADVRVRCNVHDHLVFGHPAQQILEVAAQDRPDVLVMGVQGRGALDQWMFGSTTNHVVRHATCPVLTVRPPAAGN